MKMEPVGPFERLYRLFLRQGAEMTLIAKL
jgi:hypothetical protein